MDMKRVYNERKVRTMKTTVCFCLFCLRVSGTYRVLPWSYFQLLSREPLHWRISVSMCR